jgi:hypothetical protein
MRLRLVSLLLLLSVSWIAGPARAAAEDRANLPTLLVRIRSIDSLIDDIKYLGALVGQERGTKQLDDLVRNRFPNGFAGIDTKRQIGLYGKLEENLMESSAVLMVPITEQNALLGLLETFRIKATKEDDDVYVVNVDGGRTVYFRFANGYAYATALNKDAIARNKLIAPVSMFPDKESPTFSASFRVDQIPDVYKQLLLGQAESRIGNAADRSTPGETAKQKAAKSEGAKQLSQAVASVINEGAEFSVTVDLNHRTNQLTGEVALRGKPGSALASQIAAIAKSESMFGSIFDSGAAMNFSMHGALPDKLRQAVGDALLEGIKSALGKEKDAAKRAIGEKLLQALEPSLNMGELDLGFVLNGPTPRSHYNFVAALKIKDGNKFDQAVREVVRDLPQSERSKIKFDSESAAEVKIHRIDNPDMDDNARKVLGGGEPIYVAFRDNAVFVAGGDGGLSALKDALKSRSKAVPLVLFEMSARRMAPVLASTARKEAGGSTDAESAAALAFGSGKDNDKIRAALQGGDALKLSFDMATPVLKFFNLMEQTKKPEKVSK